MTNNFRIKFFPDLQFSQNHTAYYGTSFTAKKDNATLARIPNILLLAQIFSFTQLFRQHFPKSGFIIFKYIWRNVLMQNIQKIHEADPEKNASLTDGQTNKWMDGKD